MKNWHTGKSPVERGDFQGIGVRQKEGKVVSSYINGKTKTNKNKPPKSLA
jgi:hypothetical protein